MAPPPIYFELSWSILSTIGLLTFLIGLLVCGIIGFSRISIVPIVVSAACAIANGLCYYAFYSNYPQTNRMVAGAFADITWLIQEAGLSFYSYQILNRILQNEQRKIFLGLFWSLIGSVVIVRITILFNRAIDLKHNTAAKQYTIDHLHIAYFIIIALTETVCSVFLLKTFTRAERSSLVLNSKPNLFKMLSRSAEIRLATLAPIGICRAITYSFQTSQQSATDTATQLDRFAYSLECLFPIVMIVDLLASRLSNQGLTSQSKSRTGGVPNIPPGVNTNIMEFQTRKAQQSSSFVRLGPLHEDARSIESC